MSRLTIGLAWQQLFITIVSSIVPKDHGSRLGLTVAIKIFAAILVFFVGCRIELFLNKRKNRRAQLRERSQAHPQVSRSHHNSNPFTIEENEAEYGFLEADENYEEPLL